MHPLKMFEILGHPHFKQLHGHKIPMNATNSPDRLNLYIFSLNLSYHSFASVHDIQQKRLLNKISVYALLIPADITVLPMRRFSLRARVMVIGIDHDRVCAGVVGTAIRNSTSCAGRRAAACGRAGRHNECCSGLQYQPRQHRPYKWSISILPRSQFTKSKRNLRFRRLVPLFVPIGVCVTTHDDGTASDVTIGMWRHNQQVTNHERNGKPWFSLPK